MLPGIADTVAILTGPPLRVRVRCLVNLVEGFDIDTATMRTVEGKNYGESESMFSGITRWTCGLEGWEASGKCMR